MSNRLFFVILGLFVLPPFFLTAQTAADGLINIEKGDSHHHFSSSLETPLIL